MIGGLEAEHQDRGVAVRGPGVGSLQRVEQPAVRGVQTRLRDRAHHLRPAQEALRAREPHARGGPEAGSLLEPHPGFDQDSERSLGSDPEAIRARPRSRAGQAARLHDPRRCHHAQRFHELVDVREEGRVMSARTGRDPAAQARELEGLREVAKREAVGPQLVLESGAEDARLDARRARDGVDLEHAIQPSQVDREGAAQVAEVARLDSAHHARAAAVRNCRQTLARAPFEKSDDVGFAAGEGHEIGRIRELAARRAHDVAVGLAVAVRGAVVGCAREQLGEGARRGDARRPQRDLLEARRGRDAQLRLPEARSQRAADPGRLLLARPRALEPPSPEAAARGHRRQLGRGASASSRRRSGPGWPSGRKGWMQT